MSNNKLFKHKIYNQLLKVFASQSTWYTDSYGDLKYNENALDTLVDYILQNRTYGKYYEYNSLKSYILGKITYTYHCNNKKNNVIKLSTFCNKLIDVILSSPKVYLCMIPIHGVKIDKVFHFGKMLIYPHKYYKYIVKKELIRYNTNVWLNLRDINRFTFNKLPFITIYEKAILPEGATSTACKVVQSFLNSLQFLSSDLFLPHDIGIGKKFHLMTNQNFLSFSRDKFLLDHPYKYTPFQLNLNKLMKNKSYKGYIIKLFNISNTIFNNPESHELLINKRLWNANNLIANGINSNNKQVKFISFMSSIESLVEFDEPHITNKVCKRTALMIGIGKSGTCATFHRLKKLYGLRSRIVHGSYKDVPHTSLNDIYSIACALQENMFVDRNNFVTKNNNDLISNKKTFNKFFSERKLIKTLEFYLIFNKLSFSTFLQILLNLLRREND